MDIILWAIFGGIAGWIASIVMKTDPQQGVLMDVILGVVGGIFGGFLMSLIGFGGVSGFNVYSMFVSVLGAAVLIWLGRVVRHATT